MNYSRFCILSFALTSFSLFGDNHVKTERENVKDEQFTGNQENKDQEDNTDSNRLSPVANLEDEASNVLLAATNPSQYQERLKEKNEPKQDDQGKSSDKTHLERGKLRNNKHLLIADVTPQDSFKERDFSRHEQSRYNEQPRYDEREHYQIRSDDYRNFDDGRERNRVGSFVYPSQDSFRERDFSRHEQSRYNEQPRYDEREHYYQRNADHRDPNQFSDKREINRIGDFVYPSRDSFRERDFSRQEQSRYNEQPRYDERDYYYQRNGDYRDFDDRRERNRIRTIDNSRPYRDSFRERDAYYYDEQPRYDEREHYYQTRNSHSHHFNQVDAREPYYVRAAYYSYPEQDFSRRRDQYQDEQPRYEERERPFQKRNVEDDPFKVEDSREKFSTRSGTPGAFSSTQPKAKGQNSVELVLPSSILQIDMSRTNQEVLISLAPYGITPNPDGNKIALSDETPQLKQEKWDSQSAETYQPKGSTASHVGTVSSKNKEGFMPSFRNYEVYNSTAPNRPDPEVLSFKDNESSHSSVASYDSYTQPTSNPSNLEISPAQKEVIPAQNKEHRDTSLNDEIYNQKAYQSSSSPVGAYDSNPTEEAYAYNCCPVENYPSCCPVESCSTMIGSTIAKYSSLYNNCAFCCNDTTNNWDLFIYPNYATVAYTGGRGLGYKRGFTTLGAFFAPSYLATCGFQSFIDAKAYSFNNGKWASSIGLGTRYIVDSDMVLGINGYYDYRRIHHYNFNQLGIGLELLTSNWDFRFNGYIPLGTTHHREGRLYDFSDNFIAIRQQQWSTWSGFDAEVGTWLKRKHPCDWLGLYVAAGPYCYFRDHSRHFEDRKHDQAYGGRARLLARICDFIDVSALVTYDPIWHTRVQGQLALNIPFDCGFFNQLIDRCGFESSPCLLKQMTIQPVQRNGIIVADKKCNWEWNWPDCDCSSSGPTSHSIDLSSFYWDSSAGENSYYSPDSFNSSSENCDCSSARF